MSLVSYLGFEEVVPSVCNSKPSGLEVIVREVAFDDFFEELERGEEVGNSKDN